jgi:1,4-dihydroxy-2-naphthoate octaprenyltransferase
MLAATLLVSGLYPLTQIYQIEEDLARGDLTFAAWVGPHWALRFAIVVQTLGAGVLLRLIYQLFGGAQAALAALAYAGTLLALVHWSYTLDAAAIIPNFRRVMRIMMVSSLGFLSFLCLHLFGLLS